MGKDQYIPPLSRNYFSSESRLFAIQKPTHDEISLDNNQVLYINLPKYHLFSLITKQRNTITCNIWSEMWEDVPRRCSQRKPLRSFYMYLEAFLYQSLISRVT